MKIKKISYILTTLTLGCVSQPAFSVCVDLVNNYEQFLVDGGFTSQSSPVLSQLLSAASGESISGHEVEGCDTPVNTQQIIRNTSSQISQRIMNGMVASFQGAASADELYMPDTFWGEHTISQITEESGNTNISDFDSDIYQFIGGVDKRVGDLFYGVALTYAYTEHEEQFLDSNMHSVGVTPYIAYKINDFLFASALAGYTYSHKNNVNPLLADIDNHDYTAEGNINAFKVFNDSIILKGRAGVRYKHTNSSAINGFAGRDNDYDELTWIGDGEIGYRFDSGLTVYTGTLYELYDREASAASTLVHDYLFLMRYGMDYPISDSLTIGAKIENDLNDEDRDYFTGTVHVRLEL